MDNKEFIKYIKANGKVNINSENAKENLEICSNANIELVNFYTELVETQVDPNVAIEILANLIKEDLRLKEIKLFLRKLSFVRSIEGFYFMGHRKRLLQIYDTILKGFNSKSSDEERLKELNQYKVKIDTDNTVRIASSRYEILKDGDHTDLRCISDGKIYEHIKCVGVKNTNVGHRLVTVFVNEENYTWWNRNLEYFEVIINDK